MNSKRQVEGKLGSVVLKLTSLLAFLAILATIRVKRIKFMCVVPTSMYEKPDRSQVADV